MAIVFRDYVVFDRAVALNQSSSHSWSSPVPSSRVFPDRIVLNQTIAIVQPAAFSRCGVADDHVILNRGVGVVRLPSSEDACAIVHLTVRNRETGKDAGLVLRSTEAHHGAILTAHNPRALDNRRIEKIRATKNDVFALEEDVLDIGPLGNNDSVPSDAASIPSWIVLKAVTQDFPSPRLPTKASTCHSAASRAVERKMNRKEKTARKMVLRIIVLSPSVCPTPRTESQVEHSK